MLEFMNKRLASKSPIIKAKVRCPESLPRLLAIATGSLPLRSILQATVKQLWVSNESQG